MGDRDNRTAELRERLFHRLTRLDVQVIGWLIQHEEICLRDDCHAQLQSVPLSSRE